MLYGRRLSRPPHTAANHIEIVDASSRLAQGQINLYRRVNELLTDAGEEPPVYAWWAILPPPLDVVVGLRQVHFLARYWAGCRGDAWEPDRVAEEWFPFISAPYAPKQSPQLPELRRTPRRVP